MVKRALNTDKKELFIVEEVGTIEKEHYNNRTYNTLTLKVKSSNSSGKIDFSYKKCSSYKNTVILI